MTDLCAEPYGSEMERRIMQGGFNCAGEYRLAPAAPAQWPTDVEVPRRQIERRESIAL